MATFFLENHFVLNKYFNHQKKLSHKTDTESCTRHGKSGTFYLNDYFIYFILNAPQTAIQAICLDCPPWIWHTATLVVYTIYVIKLCGCCFCYAILSLGTSWCALHGCIAQQSNPDCKGLFRWRSCSARPHGLHTEITWSLHSLSPETS